MGKNIPLYTDPNANIWIKMKSVEGLGEYSKRKLVCRFKCFYEGENMLVINPDECIDCGVC